MRECFSQGPVRRLAGRGGIPPELAEAAARKQSREEVEEKAVICLKAMLAQNQRRPTRPGLGAAAFPTVRTGRAGNRAAPGEGWSLPASPRRATLLPDGDSSSVSKHTPHPPPGLAALCALHLREFGASAGAGGETWSGGEQGAGRSALGERRGAPRRSAGDTLGPTPPGSEDGVLPSDCR